MAAPVRLREIIIVGGGTAGYMAAVALARLSATGARIRLVESAAVGTVGVGESTVPGIAHFHQRLGIDEAAFMRATRASYKLAISFEGWGAPADRYFHGFGQVGEFWQGLTFHHHWLRARAADEQVPAYGSFSLNACSATAGRFVHSHRWEGFPGVMPYAYHLEARGYAAFLGSIAEAAGVERIEGDVAGAQQDPETGDIVSLVLADGRTLDGDFFIDCSGFRGLLIEQTLGAGYEDWTHWLPCDRAMAVPCAHGTMPETHMPPYTRAMARTVGWQWQIPLQHRMGNGLVYSSALLSDDEASAQLLMNLPGAALDTPLPIRFTTGKRRKIWHHNVVALGLASGFIEPLESTSIHLVQTAVERLLRLLPDREGMGPLRDAFNRQSDHEYAAIRDFIILHYHLNQRVGEPLWDQCRTMALPDSLAQRLALFEASGDVFIKPFDNIFTEESWKLVLLQQNLIPHRFSPLAEAAPLGEIKAAMAGLAARQAALVGELPRHGDYVAAICGSAPASLETL